MIRPFVAALAALSLVAPAMATPTRGDAEQNLISTIQQTGTRIVLNCPDGTAFQGAYMSSNRLMGICVDGRSPRTWTAEEQDTLRHEAIHLAQDCMGRLADDDLETTQTITRLMRVVMESGIDAAEIERTYRRLGADDLTIVLELEAFSLAAAMSTQEVDYLVRRSCFR